MRPWKPREPARRRARFRLVVAGEVRAASRSGRRRRRRKSSELIDTSVERVQSGSALVDEAGRTMTEIIAAVQRVTDIMGEIAAASEEQSSGIDQVATAVTQMDAVTQQNAALVEEAAAASKSLEDQAGKLRSAVAVFQLDEGGYKAPVSAAPKRAAAPGRPTAVRKVSQAALQTASQAVSQAASPPRAQGRRAVAPVAHPAAPNRRRSEERLPRRRATARATIRDWGDLLIAGAYGKRGTAERGNARLQTITARSERAKVSSLPALSHAVLKGPPARLTPDVLAANPRFERADACHHCPVLNATPNPRSGHAPATPTQHSFPMKHWPSSRLRGSPA